MTETATFAAGCFWSVEIEFANTEGVVSTEVGYTGGSAESPSYEQVCGGGTGHAEAVRIEFDPERVSYSDLLNAFWEMHDPTTLNRQGPDVGTQYRSVIFVNGPKEEAEARRSIAHAQPDFPRRIVTEVVPAGPFWRAEEYHQQYLEKRGMASCRVPGVAAL